MNATDLSILILAAMLLSVAVLIAVHVLRFLDALLDVALEWVADRRAPQIQYI